MYECQINIIINNGKLEGLTGEDLIIRLFCWVWNTSTYVENRNKTEISLGPANNSVKLNLFCTAPQTLQSILINHFQSCLQRHSKFSSRNIFLHNRYIFALNTSLQNSYIFRELYTMTTSFYIRDTFLHLIHLDKTVTSLENFTQYPHLYRNVCWNESPTNQNG